MPSVTHVSRYYVWQRNYKPLRYLSLKKYMALMCLETQAGVAFATILASVATTWWKLLYET